MLQITKRCIYAMISVFLLCISGTLFAAQSAKASFKAMESTFNGRLGVYAVDTANGNALGYRENERFAMCSTSKVMGVAAFLKAHETQHNLLIKKVYYQKKDLQPYSPITSQHIDKGMRAMDLARATITTSDNTAINLLIDQIGGIDAVNDFARSIGDKTFHQDRPETALNSAIPGDSRDTTTPYAMTKSLQKMVLGQGLGKESRQYLKQWLIANETGENRIRATTPDHWVVGDKTGTCGHYGAIGDIGIIWPPDRAPIVLAIYHNHDKENATNKEKIIALATDIVLQSLLVQNNQSTGSSG